LRACVLGSGFQFILSFCFVLLAAYYCCRNFARLCSWFWLSVYSFLLLCVCSRLFASLHFLRACLIKAFDRFIFFTVRSLVECHHDAPGSTISTKLRPFPNDQDKTVRQGKAG
jgi:hypothetical protein